MHIAAMILGILGGLSLLGVSFLGASLGSLGDSQGLVIVSWAIPIIAFIGAGVVMKNGMIGGILLLVSGAGVLAVIGVNTFGIFFAILLVIGGILGTLSGQKGGAATPSS